jgi:hypothetical protein
MVYDRSIQVRRDPLGEALRLVAAAQLAEVGS